MPAKQEAQAAEIARQLEVLWAPGGWHELRVPGPRNRPAVASGYFSSPAAMAEAAFELNQRGHNVYFTINPVLPELSARSGANQVVFKPELTTEDKEILCRRWLFIDVDVKQRARGIAATDAQHQVAIDRACEIRQWLMEERNWPPPIVMSSGNGCYLLFRLQMENDEDSKELIKRVLAALAQRFPHDNDVEIDTGVFNASRIARIPGTLNQKAVATKERPHRTAKLHDVPAAEVL